MVGRTVFVAGYSDTTTSGRQLCDSGHTTVAYHAATGTQIWLKRVRADRAQIGSLAISRVTDTVVVTGGIFRLKRSSRYDYATVAYHG